MCGRRRCDVWLELVLLGEWLVTVKLLVLLFPGMSMWGGHRWCDHLHWGVGMDLSFRRAVVDVGIYSASIISMSIG